MFAVFGFARMTDEEDLALFEARVEEGAGLSELRFEFPTFASEYPDEWNEHTRDMVDDEEPPSEEEYMDERELEEEVPVPALGGGKRKNRNVAKKPAKKKGRKEGAPSKAGLPKKTMKKGAGSAGGSKGGKAAAKPRAKGAAAQATLPSQSESDPSSDEDEKKPAAINSKRPPVIENPDAKLYRKVFSPKTVEADKEKLRNMVKSPATYIAKDLDRSKPCFESGKEKNVTKPPQGAAAKKAKVEYYPLGNYEYCGRTVSFADLGRKVLGDKTYLSSDGIGTLMDACDDCIVQLRVDLEHLGLVPMRLTNDPERKKLKESMMSKKFEIPTLIYQELKLLQTTKLRENGHFEVPLYCAKCKDMENNCIARIAKVRYEMVPPVAVAMASSSRKKSPAKKKKRNHAAASGTPAGGLGASPKGKAPKSKVKVEKPYNQKGSTKVDLKPGVRVKMTVLELLPHDWQCTAKTDEEKLMFGVDRERQHGSGWMVLPFPYEKIFGKTFDPVVKLMRFWKPGDEVPPGWVIEHLVDKTMRLYNKDLRIYLTLPNNLEWNSSVLDMKMLDGSMAHLALFVANKFNAASQMWDEVQLHIAPVPDKVGMADASIKDAHLMYAGIPVLPPGCTWEEAKENPPEIVDQPAHMDMTENHEKNQPRVSLNAKLKGKLKPGSLVIVLDDHRILRFFENGKWVEVKLKKGEMLYFSGDTTHAGKTYGMDDLGLHPGVHVSIVSTLQEWSGEDFDLDIQSLVATGCQHADRLPPQMLSDVAEHLNQSTMNFYKTAMEGTDTKKKAREEVKKLVEELQSLMEEEETAAKPTREEKLRQKKEKQEAEKKAMKDRMEQSKRVRESKGLRKNVNKASLDQEEEE